MATRKSKARDKDGGTGRRLPGEAPLARAYHETARELPPPALDAEILAQARAATRAPVRRWAVPLSAAAVVMLSLGVVLQLSQRSEAPLQEFTTVSEPAAQMPARKARSAAPASPPASAPVAAAPRQSAPADTTDTARSGAGNAAAEKSMAAPAALMRARRDVATEQEKKSDAVYADVVALTVSGAPGAYYFTVSLRSTDTGCEQYTDWWEVLSEDGRLLHRQVLGYGSTRAQPFTVSGGPVAIQADTRVWVRAHRNDAGYGGRALTGTVTGGFVPARLAPDFAATAARQAPLPGACNP